VVARSIETVPVTIPESEAAVLKRAAAQTAERFK